MPANFRRLTRPNIRKLRPGERLTEAGITAEKLFDGDVRYSVNIMVDGTRIHRVIGRDSDGTTRTQAEEFVSQARSDARQDRLTLPKGRKLHLSFNKAAEVYLDKLTEIGGKDYVKNEQHLRLHLNPYFGRMRLDQISTFTLEKFRNQCRKKDLSDATINRILSTYRRMGRRFLHQWSVIPSQPAMIKLAKEDNQRVHIVSKSEEEALLNAALGDSNSYIWLFVKLGLATGLRHTEMLTAKFDGFDPVRRRLRIRAKGGKIRLQPLTKSITEVLTRERDMATDPQGWIFPSDRSKGDHIGGMSKAFERCVQRAGLDPDVVIPHIMRHTAITRLASTGADIKTIQEFSGHESLAMVLRYAHAQDEAVNSALDRMDSRTVVEHPAVKKSQDS